MALAASTAPVADPSPPVRRGLPSDVGRHKDVGWIDGMGCIELVIAPAYLWAQLGAPLDPAKDTGRLVDTVLRVTRG